MTVTLVREDTVTTATETLGWLYALGETFCTLELPWKENLRRVSCIPPGQYPCTFLPRSASGKYTNVYHVQEVPGRLAILIHAGNIASHSKGCILIGMEHGELDGQRAVLHSRDALFQFVEIMDRQPFTLDVK